MQEALCVTRIRKVYSGGFVVGEIPFRTEGRVCDGFVYFLSGRAEYSFDGYTFTATPKNFFLMYPIIKSFPPQQARHHAKESSRFHMVVNCYIFVTNR